MGRRKNVELPEELQHFVTEFSSKQIKKSTLLEKELAELQDIGSKEEAEDCDRLDEDDEEKSIEDGENEAQKIQSEEASDEDDVDYFENEDMDDPMEVLRQLQKPVSDPQPEDEIEEEYDQFIEESEDEKKQLFDDDNSFDEEEREMQSTSERLSSYQRQKQKLLSQARALEGENVQEKSWALKGEVSAKLRPENSLLEEDLEFDFQSVPPPSITTETTESIEDIIKRRIKERAFDNTVPPVSQGLKVEATLLREKRQKIALELIERTDLGEVYEKDFLKSKGESNPDEDTLDPKLKSKYKELNEIYEKISGTIDSLLFQSTNFALRTK